MPAPAPAPVSAAEASAPDDAQPTGPPARRRRAALRDAGDATDAARGPAPPQAPDHGEEITPRSSLADCLLMIVLAVSLRREWITPVTFYALIAIRVFLF